MTVATLFMTPGTKSNDPSSTFHEASRMEVANSLLSPVYFSLNPSAGERDQ